ncbi:MAG: hypothetical protein AB7U61_12660 [Methylocystis sp.]
MDDLPEDNAGGNEVGILSEPSSPPIVQLFLASQFRASRFFFALMAFCAFLFSLSPRQNLTRAPEQSCGGR